MDNILDPNEQVLWSDKPEKKSFMLPGFGGIPFALAFSVAFILLLNFGLPQLGPSIYFILALLLGFIVFLIFVPPIWQYKKLAHVGYMITNQRLIVKTGIYDYESWFVNLEKIKDVFVKIGFVDKLFGTGKLYPITAEYPYEPKIYGYSEGGMHKLKKVYNFAEQKYEEIPEMELYKKTQHHPRLEGLREPYAVQKLLKEAIFGAETNFVNCKYCNYRYDLNKEGKCPHCGGPQRQKYSL